MESRKRYLFNRLLDELADKRGRGTELISVYVIPGFDLNKVTQQLRGEKGTAENIKSKATRKNVIGALEKLIQFLQRYIQTHKRAPPNGMALFCGNVSAEEGVSDIRLYWAEPLEPVPVRMYRCDQQFVVEPLREMLKAKESIGLLVLDSKEATIATMLGKRVDIVKHLTSGVWGKHRRGGQSARRFERLREIALHEFMKRIAEISNWEFSRVPNLKAILIGGPGPIKDEFIKKNLLHAEIQKKIVAVLDAGYTDEQGIKELVNKSGEVLAGLEVMKEKSLMQRFLSGLVAEQKLVAYGDGVKRRLEQGAVELLLISEGIRSFGVYVRCQACGNELREMIENVENYSSQLAERKCPKCGEARLTLVESRDVVEELCELANRYGTNVEFISGETEEGQQLLSGFRGLAALLRFEVS